jgi:hypothetical protein
MQKYIRHDMWGNGTPTKIAFPIVAHGLSIEGMEVNFLWKKNNWPMDDELLIITY